MENKHHIGVAVLCSLMLGAKPATRPTSLPTSFDSPVDLYKVLPDEFKPHHGTPYGKVTAGLAERWWMQNLAGVSVTFPTMIDKMDLARDPVKLYGRCWGKTAIAGIPIRDMTTVTFLPASKIDHLKEFTGKNAAFKPVGGKIKQIELLDVATSDADLPVYSIKIQIEADDVAKFQQR